MELKEVGKSGKMKSELCLDSLMGSCELNRQFDQYTWIKKTYYFVNFPEDFGVEVLFGEYFRGGEC